MFHIPKPDLQVRVQHTASSQGRGQLRKRDTHKLGIVLGPVIATTKLRNDTGREDGNSNDRIPFIILSTS